jgi:hypothetical protein
MSHAIKKEAAKMTPLFPRSPLSMSPFPSSHRANTPPQPPGKLIRKRGKAGHFLPLIDLKTQGERQGKLDYLDTSYCVYIQ